MMLTLFPITLIFLPSIDIIYDNPRRGDQASVSQSAFALLYSELVQYHQSRVASITDLERRLESSGFGVGLRVLELLAYRSREVSPSHSFLHYFF